MFLYVHTVRQSLEQHYPEKGFILEHCSFLDVSWRKYQLCDIGAVIDKFSNNYINRCLCIQQYRMFVGDSTLDFVFDITCKKDSAVFFIHLLQSEEYSELARLALLKQCVLLNIIPSVHEKIMTLSGIFYYPMYGSYRGYRGTYDYIKTEILPFFACY